MSAAPCTLPRHDPSLWPLRLTRAEVRHVTGYSESRLFRRIKNHLFPRPDSDGMWARDIVTHYLSGGIKQLDEHAARLRRADARQVARDELRRVS